MFPGGSGSVRPALRAGLAVERSVGRAVPAASASSSAASGAGVRCGRAGFFGFSLFVLRQQPLGAGRASGWAPEGRAGAWSPAQGAASHREPEQRLRRAARVHPQRAGRHQALQDQDAALGYQLHRLPHGGARQGRAGRRGLQGRAQEGRAPRRQEEARAAAARGIFSCFRSRRKKA